MASSKVVEMWRKHYKTAPVKEKEKECLSDSYDKKCQELYNDFKNPHRKHGVERKTNCEHCGYPITYLFLPGYMSGKCLSTGKSELKIMVIIEDARVLSDGNCPSCDKSLFNQLKSEGRVLR